MAIVLTTRTRSGTREGEAWSSSRQGAREYNGKTKVSGGFKTLSDGSKFRLATNYTRFTNQLIDGSGGQLTTRWIPGGPRYTYSSKSGAGGYVPDLIFTNMSVPSSIGAQKSTSSYPEIPLMMRNEAVTKALNKLADQKINLGENLATSAQTARMLAGATKNLADFLMTVYRDRSIRPYLLSSFKSLLKTGVDRKLADKYLEYIYGWKPLMSDIYALSQLAKGHATRSLLLSADGTSHQSGATKSSSYWGGSYNSTVFLDPGIEDATVRCKLWAQIDPDWSGARSLNQLGLLNPASLIWELTPWSFVVDWLVPIGPVMSALSAPAGLIFIDGSLAVRTRTSIPYREQYYGDYYTVLSESLATGTWNAEGYARQSLGGWPLPGFWYDPDPFRGDRIFKASALAVSNVKGVRNSMRG